MKIKWKNYSTTLILCVLVITGTLFLPSNANSETKADFSEAVSTWINDFPRFKPHGWMPVTDADKKNPVLRGFIPNFSSWRTVIRDNGNGKSLYVQAKRRNGKIRSYCFIGYCLYAQSIEDEAYNESYWSNNRVSKPERSSDGLNILAYIILFPFLLIGFFFVVTLPFWIMRLFS